MSVTLTTNITEVVLTSVEDPRVVWTIQTGGTSGPSVTAHADLTGLNDAGAHPISAISGLTSALDGKLTAAENLADLTDVAVAIDNLGLVGPNQPDGYARLDGDGTLPDVLMPSSIARDSEVTAALAGKQAASATLSLLAALTSTAVGRSLLEAADPAALRTIIGLAVGSITGTVAAGDDARFTDARTPSDGSVTNIKVAANAGIDPTKLAYIPFGLGPVISGIGADFWAPPFTALYIAPAAGKIYWGPPLTIAQARTLKAVSMRNQTNFSAGATAQYGLYLCDPATGLPVSLLLSTADVAVSASAPVARTIAISQAVTAGMVMRAGLMVSANVGNVGTVATAPAPWTVEGGLPTAVSTASRRFVTNTTYGVWPSAITAPMLVSEDGPPVCPVVQFT